MRNVGVWSLGITLILAYSLFILAVGFWAVPGLKGESWPFMATGFGLTLAVGFIFLELERRGLLAGAAGFAPPAPEETGCCR